MTAAELLADLRARGVRLWADGADIRFSAPRGTVDSQATELLSRHKPELLSILAHQRDVTAKDGGTRANGRQFSLEDHVFDLDDLPDWRLEDQHPFIRYVAPFRGFLYQTLGLDKVFVKGQGCFLFEADGTAYADFIAQFGAVPFGHDPEPIWEALEVVRRQSRPNLVIGSVSSAAGELAERLVAIAPPGLAHIVFTNSGAEAVEVAFKLARSRTGRIGILSAKNGFHGLTLAGMSATDKEFFQRGFGAPAPGFAYVPFGDLAALESALAFRPDFFAAFLLEIVQGESGIHVVPPGYLAEAHEICRRYNVLLIVDEVQTGLGRTGRLFACEAEGVTPDILTLAKALGGGLVPIGACLYTREVFTEQFDLRHGSTYAGNAVACQAALASIDLLTQDDQRLVRHVASTGAALQNRLRQLQRDFDPLIRDVRGRGLMIGVELDLDTIGEKQRGLLAILQRQGLLFHMVVSFLLNVEHVRLAPSLTQGTVLRIEPPLTADTALCDRLVEALARLLDVLRHGDAGALLSHFMPKSAFAHSDQIQAERSGSPYSIAMKAEADPKPPAGRFAFVVHLLSVGDLRRFDPSLASFADEDLDLLKSRIGPFFKPFAFSRLALAGRNCGRADGELIVLPHLPRELVSLDGNEAVALVQSAVDLAVERGAEVVGLGGFSSIIADGGLALRVPKGARITSGNSLTTWAAVQAVEAVCRETGIELADATVAVIGATGAIGRAIALLCAERAGRLILIGNPVSREPNQARLRAVAIDCRDHRAVLGDQPYGRRDRTCEVAQTSVPVRTPADTNEWVTVTSDIDHYLPDADVVFAATSAVQSFISAQHLRKRAIVCDVSRPFNLSAQIEEQRPDVRIIKGGVVRVPEGCILGDLEERDQPNSMVACAAETVLLSLSRQEARQLCGPLSLATINELGKFADAAGFSIVT